MKLTTLVEITRIRQEVREPDVVLETTHITSPEDAFCVAKRFIQDDDREVFLVILLNTKNRVIAVHRAHVGSINSSVVHPREIFKSAILNNATSLIVFHIGMKNQWRNYNLLYPQCYINFAFFLMAKLSLKVGWR